MVPVNLRRDGHPGRARTIEPVEDDVANAGDADDDALWKPTPGDPEASGHAQPARRAAPEVGPLALASEPGPPSDDGEVTDEPSPWSRAGGESTREAPMRWRPDEIAAAARRERAARLAAIDRARPKPVAAVEGAPSSSVTGELVLVAICLLVVVLVAGGVVVALARSSSSPDDDLATAGSDAPVLPTGVAERWRIELAGRVDQVRLGTDAVVLAAGALLLVADAATGDRRWERDLGAPVEALWLIDDRVAVVLESGPRERTLIVVDDVTGAEQWRRVGDGGTRFFVEVGSVFELAPDGRDGNLELRLLDPDNGAPLDRVTVADEVVAPAPHVAASVADGIRLHALADLAPVAPSIDPFQLRSVTLVGGTVVGFDREATIVAYDAGGRRSDERPFVSDAFGEFTGRAELVGGVPGNDVGVVASGSSLGFHVVGGRIEVAWTLSGRVGAPVVTDIGPVSVARVVDDETGEINLSLVDPRVGTTLAVTDAGLTRESDPIVGRDGYVVAPEIGAASRVVTAFDLDGRERWQLGIDLGADYHVGGGMIAVVVVGLDASSVVVYG